MATSAAVVCDIHNGLYDSTEQKLCANPDGEQGKIGKSVGYAVLHKV